MTGVNIVLLNPVRKMAYYCINFSVELNIKQWQAKIWEQSEAWLSLPD